MHIYHNCQTLLSCLEIKEEMATEGDTEGEVCLSLKSVATDSDLVLIHVTGNTPNPFIFWTSVSYSIQIRHDLKNWLLPRFSQNFHEQRIIRRKKSSA